MSARATVRPLAAKRLDQLAAHVGGPANVRRSMLVSALVYSTPEWQIDAMVRHFVRAEVRAGDRGGRRL